MSYSGLTNKLCSELVDEPLFNFNDTTNKISQNTFKTVLGIDTTNNQNPISYEDIYNYKEGKIDTSVYLPHVIQLYNELIPLGSSTKSIMKTRLNALRSEIENIKLEYVQSDKNINKLSKIVSKYNLFSDDSELSKYCKKISKELANVSNQIGLIDITSKTPQINIFEKVFTIVLKSSDAINLSKLTSYGIPNYTDDNLIAEYKNKNKIYIHSNISNAKSHLPKAINYYLSELLRRKILDIFDNNVVGIMRTAIDTFCNDDICTKVTEEQKPSENAKSEMEDAKKIISENKKILKEYALKVCEVRRAEGYYINETLRQIRETIAETIMAKGEDMLYNSPDFIIQCKDDYCPDPNLPCFQLINKPLDNPKIQSIIFKDIYDYMKEINTDLTVKQFYKDIIVGIFCVLNISTGANNPPPVPYVDINQLKKAFFNKSKEYCVKDLIEQLTYRINRINNPLICKDNANSPECKGINLIVPEPTGSNYPVISFDNFTIEKQKTLVDIVCSFNELSEDTNETDQIQKLIEEIDNFNAATAIGTLDFTDSVAKYNTVHNTCADNNDKKRESIDKSIIFHANSYETKVINQKFGGSSKTKRNKKKRNNKTRKVK